MGLLDERALGMDGPCGWPPWALGMDGLYLVIDSQHGWVLCMNGPSVQISPGQR